MAHVLSSNSSSCSLCVLCIRFSASSSEVFKIVLKMQVYIQMWLVCLQSLLSIGGPAFAWAMWCNQCDCITLSPFDLLVPVFPWHHALPLPSSPVCQPSSFGDVAALFCCFLWTFSRSFAVPPLTPLFSSPHSESNLFCSSFGRLRSSFHQDLFWLFPEEEASLLEFTATISCPVLWIVHMHARVLRVFLPRTPLISPSLGLLFLTFSSTHAEYKAVYFQASAVFLVSL